MQSLVAIKDHIFDVTLDWTFVEELMSVLQPAEELTVKLQTVQYTIGDFVADYSICLYEIRKKTRGTTMLGAMNLEHDLQARQPMVFRKIHFLAALYLDPRFNNKESNNTGRYLTRDDKFRCVVCIKIYN